MIILDQADIPDLKVCALILPLNSKVHTMETRKGEKFQVQKANTDRLKKCAIIYMQNLLNEQEKV